MLQAQTGAGGGIVDDVLVAPGVQAFQERSAPGHDLFQFGDGCFEG